LKTFERVRVRLIINGLTGEVREEFTEEEQEALK